ncbi:hypothetical protein Goshw_014097, partial [Gossypium schwendimanii]|nr:hypothetical protein [Gossypium schwendimanii]
FDPPIISHAKVVLVGLLRKSEKLGEGEEKGENDLDCCNSCVSCIGYLGF